MRSHRCLTALLVLSLFLIDSPARGGGGQPLSDFERGLMLSTEIRDEYIPTPVLGATVEVRVTGIIARAKVTQFFTNPTEKWVEGIYVFPLPEGAAVDTLRLIVGDRVIE
jgi:Ca-activated chloride channel family protein